MFRIVFFLMAAGMVWGAETRPVSDQELTAQMPADLGPATVDVSHYPVQQQKNYALFLQKCSRCHTPARAINSSLTSENDWRHFVSLMHGRLLSRSMGEPWKVEEGRAIIDFLAYDSQVRKVDQAQSFKALQEQLAIRFQDVQKEKTQRALRHPAQPSAPYTGANP